jgi:sugar transferase (PEP-CTERM system associated)
VIQQQFSVSTYLEMLGDVLLCFVAVLLAAWTIEMVPAWGLFSGDLWREAVLPAAAFALVMSLLYTFMGLYRPSDIGFDKVLLRVVVALAAGGYITYLGLKAMSSEGHPSRLIGYAGVYVLLGFTLVRASMWLFRRFVGSSRILIVGLGPEALQIARDLSSGRDHHRSVVGFYPTAVEGEDVINAPDGLPIFRSGRSLAEIVAAHKVTEIVVAAREQRGGAMPMDDLLACRIQGVPVLDLAAFYERSRSEVPLDSLKASFLVYGRGFVQGTLRKVTKRTFDIVTSSVLLLLALPVMALTALAIRLDSKGPILYSQDRVGLGGKVFPCIKFRSMRTDAEKDGVARWAIKGDARVTRVGRFIRKTRIDELPQLISVLKGDMSMVGPRPERPSFVADLRQQIPFYDLRHSIKPGVTGWAQVRFTYGASLEDAKRKHQFDLYYLKNNSLLLDLQVIAETVAVVVFREGAV